jgi:serine phosphatase RsbU (regulator of sigma subunit)/anti-sigma regulatory factor (Ser/Thr protein kinase)
MSLLQNFWQRIAGERQTAAETVASVEPQAAATIQTGPAVDIPPGDPLFAYFLTAPGAVDVDTLNMDSPALRQMKEAGVKLALPLVSQGELVGVLSLGPRLSEQEYSADDRRLLNNLATQAAPALRVAQLVRIQQAEARERERIEQELKVAGIIQQTLLPKDNPALPGWEIATYWQPARAVGGDFYDFVTMPNGRMALLVGDVTDKGVPAALVMASTRSILRAAIERLASPGEVLARANEVLCPDIPANMFVTCLCAIFDPATGHLVFANAGHNLPYVTTSDGVEEVEARGMPLGLMPGMDYEETAITLPPGSSMMIYSDGLVEAHNPNGEMYGFPQLKATLSACDDQPALLDCLLAHLETFVGPSWEQEDDVTLVVLARDAGGGSGGEGQVQTLAAFDVASTPGNEREAIDRVAAAVAGLPLTDQQVEQLKTAVGETTMNAMEHGNKYREDAPVQIAVMVSEGTLTVRVTDEGGGQPIPAADAPDLEAKLAGDQPPRGWGLFLIENMVDEMRVSQTEQHHIVDLIMRLEEGGDHDGDTV